MVRKRSLVYEFEALREYQEEMLCRLLGTKPKIRKERETYMLYYHQERPDCPNSEHGPKSV